METNDYRRAWAHWLVEALPLLEREEYAAALKTFPRPQVEALPFKAAPQERRIALISSAGAYDRDRQAPFASQSAIGDVTHRVFSTELPAERIAFRHGHYDAGPAERDREVVLPRHALRNAGAELTDNVVSYMGFCLDWPTFIEQTVPQVIAQLQSDGANCALLVPV
jgi:hypothetical protein